MNDDRISTYEWKRFHYKARKALSRSEALKFDVGKIDEEVNEVVSGYNYRTFPRNGAWKDENGFLYEKIGLFVFNFRGHHGEKPKKRVRLWKSARGITVILSCFTVKCTMNRREVLDGAIAEGQAEAQYSRVCGRVVLQLEKYDILPPKENAKRRVHETKRKSASTGSNPL